MGPASRDRDPYLQCTALIVWGDGSTRAHGAGILVETRMAGGVVMVESAGSHATHNIGRESKPRGFSGHVPNISENESHIMYFPSRRKRYYAFRLMSSRLLNWLWSPTDVGVIPFMSPYIFSITGPLNFISIPLPHFPVILFQKHSTAPQMSKF